MPFRGEVLSLISATHTLEHLPQDDAKTTLAQAYKALKPNGKLIAAVPHSRYEQVMGKIIPGYHSPNMHQHIFETREISGLVRNTGFEIEKVETKRWFIAVGIITQALVSKIFPCVKFSNQVGFADANYPATLGKVKSLARQVSAQIDNFRLFHFLNNVFPFEICIEASKARPVELPEHRIEYAPEPKLLAIK